MGHRPPGPRRGRASRPRRHYLISTLAPCSSRAALIFSASSLVTPSLTGLGAASTRSFASLRPSPVSSRTTLMTGILFGPTSVRTAVNSVCSSSAAAAGAAPAGGRRGAREGDRRGGGDAEAVLELLLEVRELEDGHLLEGLEQLVGGNRGHWFGVSWKLAPRRARLVSGVRDQAAAASPRLSMSAWTRPDDVPQRGVEQAGRRWTAARRSHPAPRRGAPRGTEGRPAWPTLSASIARDPSTPPVILTILYGRVASRTAFAVADSSVPKAIAVGPDEERREGLGSRRCPARRCASGGS